MATYVAYAAGTEPIALTISCLVYVVVVTMMTTFEQRTPYVIAQWAGAHDAR